MKKNKLIVTLYIALIALSVASVSMSVAWFATSRVLYVNSINISFDADRELEISLSKDDGYVEHIDHTELEATGVFLPLTTAHSDEWTSQKKDSPIFYDESNATEAEIFTTYKEADHGYFSQKFYIRGDDDMFITIDPEKSYIRPNEEYNASYAEFLYDYYQRIQDEHYDRYKEFTVDELYERLNNVVKAMRFSILIKDENEYSYTIIDPHYEEETLLGGLLDNAMDQYYDYYHKESTNEYYERLYGDYNINPEDLVYDEPLAQDSEFNDPNQVPTAFNARHKQGVKRLNLEKSIEEKNLEIKKEGAINLEDFKNDKKPFHFPIKMDEPKELVVSIYIEGWDLDSVNYTMGAAFFSNLTFTIEREM